MRRTVFIFLAVTMGLLVVLTLVRDPSRWPAPEPRPYQGEAVESAQGVASRHSDVALARLIREPQNTWSNLAFVGIGAWLLGTGRSRAARTLGLPALAVGVGSFLYHASASADLRALDVGAMYWLFGMAAVYCASIVSPMARPAIERHAGTAAAVTLALAVALTFSRNVVVAGFKPLSLTVVTGVSAAVLILTLADTARRRESVSAALQFLGIVTLFGVAVYLQISDRPGGPLYRPGALVQAHALWHVLAAGSFAWAIALLDRAPAVPSAKV